MTEKYYNDGKPSLDDLLLEHHGVKGMHWGSKHNKTNIIRAARDNNAKRMSDLDYHATALTFAKTQKEKQAHLDKIHALADEGLKSGDHVKARKLTRVGKAGAAAAVLATVGLAAPVGLVGLHVHHKAQAKADEAVLNTYKNSSMKDYHHAGKE